MKKLTAIFAILILATTTKVNAQIHDISVSKMKITKTSNGDGQGDVILIIPSLMKGTNRMQVKELKGTLIITTDGSSFSKVIFNDDAGKSTTLTATRGGTNGAPKPECKTKLPDACFSSPDKNIGMCICRPDDLSNGEEQAYSIALHLTAVQKERSKGATLQVQGN